MSSRSSARRMNGSWLGKSAGSTTKTAVCPGPAKPGSGAAVVIVLARLRRIGELVVMVESSSPLPRDGGFRRRRPPGREIRHGADDAEGEDRPRDPGRPERLEPEQRVEREHSRTDEAERQATGGDHQRELDPLRRHEE